MYKKNKKKFFLIKPVFAIVTTFMCRCFNQNINFKPKNQGQFKVDKIKVHSEHFENIYIKPDCLDLDCACEGEMCKLNKENDDTETTEDGYMFSPFAMDVLDFLDQEDNLHQDEVKTDTSAENNNLKNNNERQSFEADKHNNTENQISVNNKKIDISNLNEILKIKEKETSFTEINERIKITPKFVIITNTKSKIMMNFSVSF